MRNARFHAKFGPCSFCCPRPFAFSLVTTVATAEIDNDPLTVEDEKALAEAAEWSKHNEPIPHEQVLAELGITQAEIEDYRESA